VVFTDFDFQLKQTPMPSKSKRKRFANRAEQTAWWEANEEAVANSFEKDLNEGYVGPCTVVVTGGSTATKIRLSSRDVAKVRAQAGKRGLRHQVYLKTIIHEALREAETAQKASAA
jgi:predicted DNA binding CopG/RHH family protein